MVSDIEHRLALLAGSEGFAQGLRLFQEGAVLDVYPDPRGIEARVANAEGRFERVRLFVRREAMSARCSCTHQSDSLCPHAVASLLELARKAPDYLAAAEGGGLLATSQPGESFAAPESAAAGQCPAPPRLIPNGRRTQSLRALLSGPRVRGLVRLQFPEALPVLDSRWGRVALELEVLYAGRSYSATNIRRLVETGGAAGHMGLADFDPQAQQIMKFLVGHAEVAGSQFILGTHDLADLLHCLTGFRSAYCGSARLSIHPDHLALVLVVETQGEDVVVSPALQLVGRGLLPPMALQPVAARAGCWLGTGTEYWWLPAVVDSAWLRCFLKGEAVRVTPADLGAMTELCQEGAFPVRLVPAAGAVTLSPLRAECVPVLSLDWAQEWPLARLEFDYGGQRVGTTDPPLLWTETRFTARDAEAEQAATAELTEAGFTPVAGCADTYTNESPLPVLGFLQARLPRLEHRWRVFCTGRFLARRAAADNPVLRVRSLGEGRGWFDLECQVTAADGTELPWDLLAAAIAAGQSFVRLPAGTLVRLPEELLQVLKFLSSRTLERSAAVLRFSSYSALAVGAAAEPFLRDPWVAWQRLRDRLAQRQGDAGRDLQLPAGLGTVLRDYQREGLAWLALLEDCGFHGVLADEMGLGKTVQALAAVARRRLCPGTRRTSLVVCPTSLVENWVVEASRFVPQLRTVAIHGVQRHQLLTAVADFDLVVTSYALLRRDIQAYAEVEFDYVILDEAQHIKNPQTANARTCKALRAEHRLILTGTPLENSLREVWSLFDFLLPGLLGSAHAFHREFERPMANGERDRVLTSLAAHIRPFILRRTKADVCRQLPPKTEQVVYCELSPRQAQLYAGFLAVGQEVLRRVREQGWQQHGRFELLAVLMRLRQICCHPMLLPADLRPADIEHVVSAKTELLEEIVLEAIDSGHRLLVFSQFTSYLELVRTWLDEQGILYEYLDGATKDRQARVDRFNGDHTVPVFLLSLKAGGTGLNLTGADMVVHCDQWWNPMVEDQATDRSHRIGQVRPVTSLKLIARHTVEERILQLQEHKRDLFNRLMAGVPGQLGDLTAEDVEFLLQPGAAPPAAAAAAANDAVLPAEALAPARPELTAPAN